MAKTLSKTGITNGQTIQPSHVTQSIDAFTGTEAYDISLSGSLTLTGNQSVTGSLIVSNSITSSKLTSDDGTLFLGYNGFNNITIEDGGDLFINSVGGAIDIESDDGYRISVTDLIEFNTPGGTALTLNGTSAQFGQPIVTNELTSSATLLSGSSTVSGSLTVALPIPGKDNYIFDISSGKNVYTDLPIIGVNFTSSGLVIIGEEDSNMGKSSIFNQNSIFSIPALGGASFSQSLSAFIFTSGSTESFMGLNNQDQTPIGGDKFLSAIMQITPDGTFTGNRQGRVGVNDDCEPQMQSDDASGQQAIARVSIDEFVAGMTVYTDIPSSITSSFRVFTSTQNIFDVKTNGMVILSQLSSSFSASDDADAATKGIPTGGLYHTNGTVKIRLS